MFFRLGILNVKRQLARSLLVLLTLILATISLTNSLFIKNIAPLRVAPFLSKFTGGEILVAPLRWAGQQRGDVTEAAEYRHTRLVNRGLTWLDWFYPELYSQGFWTREAEPKDCFTPQDLDLLAQFPGVEEAISSPMLPVFIQAVGSQGQVEYPVRIMPAREGIQNLAGSSFPQNTPLDEGLWLNAHMQAPPSAPTYKEDENITLLLPRATSNGGLEFAQAQAVDLPLGSYINIPTRAVVWHGPGENIWDQAPSTQQETGQLLANVAWVSEATWQMLLQKVGLAPLPLANLALRVSSLHDLDETLVHLGQAFPHLTFIHMNKIEERLYETGKMEYFRRAPKHIWQTSEEAGLAVPHSFAPIFSLLLLAIAGLLLGGHMLTGVAARNKEIGMLRALGARRKDVLWLGVGETGYLTFIGVSIGFFSIRFLGTIMELRGGRKLLTVLGRNLIEYGQIMGIALAVSLLFSLPPIWKLAQVTPMEVLRHE